MPESTTTPGFQDILYTKRGGIARIVINRPEVRNAFRARTVEELIGAFQDAWDDASVGVVVLTGTGDRAFCSGGDQKAREGAGYGGMRGGAVEHLHAMIRNIPKPVIAAVNGYAIGGGHVLHVLCDLSIASDRALFGQVGPRVGSVDPGYGTAYLARVVGEKKAREDPCRAAAPPNTIDEVASGAAPGGREWQPGPFGGPAPAGLTTRGAPCHGSLPPDGRGRVPPSSHRSRNYRRKNFAASRVRIRARLGKWNPYDRGEQT
jgi:hypothetical protein